MFFPGRWISSGLLQVMESLCLRKPKSYIEEGFCPEVFKDPLFYFLVLGFDKLPLWGILLISAGSAVVCALVVWFFVCPRMKKKIDRKYRVPLQSLGKGTLCLTNFSSQ